MNRLKIVNEMMSRLTIIENIVLKMASVIGDIFDI